MSINYQLTYSQGFDAGQRLYARSPNYRVAELRKEADAETAKQDLPMVLQVHYKDGIIAGYQAKRQEGNTEQKRQS